MNTRILLADDHKLIRDGLRTLLEKHRDLVVVAEADDGRHAVALTAELRPDLVIMDVSMRELNGIEATRQIRQRFPRVRVLALSMYADRRYASRMLEAGASGYLLKDCAFDELVEAVRAVMGGRTYLAEQLAGTGATRPDVRRAPPDPAAPRPITPREREVLQCLAEGKSTKETAADLGLSPKTVDVHRRNIMQKLGVSSIPELTRYAIREGLTALEE